MTTTARQIEDRTETFAESADALEVMFREALDRWEIRTTGDNRVTEEVAAMLLGYDPGTLRNRRMAGQAPRALKLGSRVSYRLRDLATWLAAAIREF